MNESKVNSTLINECISEAKKAFRKDEVPVGAIVIKDGIIIGRGHNLKESQKDTTAHAEILAIKDASTHIKDWRLNDCTLITSLEPCPMCAGAILHARITHVVYLAKDVKWGALGTKIDLSTPDVFNHTVSSEFVEVDDAKRLLQQFFQGKRQLQRPDKQNTKIR